MKNKISPDRNQRPEDIERMVVFMRQGYFSTFRPDVKLPTLGMILASLHNDQLISIHCNSDESVILSRTRACAVPVQKVLRFLDCQVVSIVVIEDFLNIVIVYGGAQ